MLDHVAAGGPAAPQSRHNSFIFAVFASAYLSDHIMSAVADPVLGIRVGGGMKTRRRSGAWGRLRRYFLGARRAYLPPMCHREVRAAPAVPKEHARFRSGLLARARCRIGYADT